MRRIEQKDAEIERLRHVVLAQVERLDYLETRHAKEFNLLVRAAEALEDEFGSPNDPAYGIKGPVHKLIDELRKAAQ